jgi:hypothetical protein
MATITPIRLMGNNATYALANGTAITPGDPISLTPAYPLTPSGCALLITNSDGTDGTLTLLASDSEAAIARYKGDLVVSIARGSTLLLLNLEGMRFVLRDGSIAAAATFNGTISCLQLSQ